MLYLISLLELSKVPFSLVDEINQGMDQRAERAVHNQLVQAVCEKDDVGQCVSFSTIQGPLQPLALSTSQITLFPIRASATDH